MTAIRRIGINAVFLEPKMGGLETYVLQLLPELMALRPDVRFTVFASGRGAEHLRRESWAADVQLVTHPLLGVRYVRAVSELTLLGRLAARERLDVLHSVAMTGPLRPRVAHVVTLGDLIWLLHPGTVEWVTRSTWRVLVPPIARRADRLLTFSEASRRDITASLRIPEQKIDVVPLGPGGGNGGESTAEPELRRRFGLGDRRVVLTVSAKRSHKNLERLVAAMGIVHAAAPDAVLVLPGNPTPYEAELRARAEEAGIGEFVLFPDYVDAPDLEGLYGLASCFVFPSLREGFGLPVLEAMRRGVPVACSNASALPEVAGAAARYFDPTDVNEIAVAIRELLENGALAEELARAGLERQALFTWRGTAEGTLESYERAYAAHRA